MSDLDKKLQDILNTTYSFGNEDKDLEFYGTSNDDEIEAIKQAFIDEGWIPYKPFEYTPEGKKPAWWSKTPELMTGDEHKARTAGLMTGQEWYDRFEKEVGQYEAGGWIDDTLDNVLLAAKKAAGIEE